MKAKKIKKGDTIGIVSLSSGILGEDFISHEKEIGQRRLEEMGFNIRFMENSLKGLKYIEDNPEKRAEDLKSAFKDDDIKAVICAIGGIDTYRTLPYLMDDEEFLSDVKNNPKIFLGFSDSTVNHFMFAKLGLNSFYGQAFLPDIAELEDDMLPYSKKYFEDLFIRGVIKFIRPSEVFYDERKSFGREDIGKKRIYHRDTKGFEIIKGSGKFKGKILGGCIETINDMIYGERHSDEVDIIKKYGIFPKKEDWKGRILLLETSETQSSPEKFKSMLLNLKSTGIFDYVSGVIAGKPMDEKYYEDYKKIYIEVLKDYDLSIVYNINTGHSTPRCIIPFGIETVVDAEKNTIEFMDSILQD